MHYNTRYKQSVEGFMHSTAYSTIDPAVKSAYIGEEFK